MQAQPDGDAEEDGKPLVLAVEDVVLVRLLVASYLREKGFYVIESGSVEDAIRVLRAGVRVDIVFSDVHMGGGPDGFELVQWIRHNRPDVKVALGSGVAGTEEKAAADGYDGPIVAKPYDPHILERQLRALLAAAG